MLCKRHLVLLTLFHLSHQNNDVEVPGIPLHRTRSSTAQRILQSSSSPEPCRPGQFYSICTGCNEVRSCLGDLPDYRYCPQVTPDAPFCNNGECSTVPGTGFDCPEPRRCIDIGYFPDPSTCAAYHYCEEKHDLSVVYNCPDGYVFNPETFLCKRKSSSSDCMKVTCDPKKTFTTYGSSKRFFGYCLYASSSIPYDMQVYKCPENKQFDGRACTYQCTREGRFADSLDSRKYYECIGYSNVLQAIERICTDGKVFDPVVFTCIRPSMTVPPTTTSRDYTTIGLLE